jgi:hypothetical protein
MNNLVKRLTTDKTLPILFTFNDFQKFGYEKNIFEKEVIEGFDNKFIDCVYGDIFRLDVKYGNRVTPKRFLSQIIVPNSYISMYYVLCDYNWIPEFIFSVTSVTTEKDCTIETNGYGSFIYTNLYNELPTAGIYIEKDYEGSYKVAKPLRALCDLIYFKEKDFLSVENLYEIYRIHRDSLEEDLTSADFDELQGTFGIERIEKFLRETRKELKI